MKRVITSFFAILLSGYVSGYAYSQQYLPLTGGELTGSVKLYTGGYPYIDFGVNSSNYWRFLYDNPSDKFLIQKDGITRLTIGSNGRLSGTYADFAGNLSVGSPNDSRIYMQNTTPGIGQNWNLISDADGAYKIGIYGVGDFLTINPAGNTSLSGSLTATSAMFNGNLGVGTINPAYPLDLSKVVNGGYVARIINTSGATSSDGGLIVETSTASAAKVLSLRTNGVENFSLDGTATAFFKGNVGIGTSTPDSKLTVAGKIHSQEVKVTITAGADFVFQKDYKLKPLSEVAEYISINKHLPEIASANDMKKNGVELGEMNIKLLQKIEELTLYMLEQNKESAELRKELEVQKKLVQQQNERIAKLENSNK